jgi:glycine cleavage system H protein
VNETDQVVPDDLLYSTDHQWVRVELRNGVTIARTGITHYAQDTLGAVQFVALPVVGAQFAAAAPCGEAEASKAVTDLYAPLSGTVIAINEHLLTEPSLVNSDPYGAGWLYELELADAADAQSLLGPEPYRALVP